METITQGKKSIKLNESDLRQMVMECVKRLIKENNGDFFMNNDRKMFDDDGPGYDIDNGYTEEEVRDYFDNNIAGFSSYIKADDVEVSVIDDEIGIANIHIEKDDWEFWFQAHIYRENERDLVCNLDGTEIEYNSPSCDHGYFKAANNQWVTIYNYFDYEI